MFLIRFCLVCFLFYMVLKFVGLFLRGLRAGLAGPAEPERPKDQKRMVRDEVCGMYIPDDEAVRLKKDGREHFFCSEECRRLFLEGRKRPEHADGGAKRLP